MFPRILILKIIIFLVLRKLLPVESVYGLMDGVTDCVKWKGKLSEKAQLSLPSFVRNVK